MNVRRGAGLDRRRARRQARSSRNRDRAQIREDRKTVGERGEWRNVRNRLVAGDREAAAHAGRPDRHRCDRGHAGDYIMPH
jgi:hypothetical protein